MCARLRGQSKSSGFGKLVEDQVDSGGLPGKVNNPIPTQKGASSSTGSNNAMNLESTNTNRKSLTASDNYQG
jgi:hypothetical protein